MRNDETEPSETAVSNRRRFLAALGGIGITGLAGCVGDDGTDTPTEGGETTDPSPTTQQQTGSDPGPTDAPTDTDPGPTDPGSTDTPTDGPTDTPTETEPPTCNVSEEPLLSFGGELQFQPGEEKTIAATVQNPYLFEITNGSVTLDPPNGDWTISGPANDNNTFESLGVGSSQTAEWTITAPSSAAEGAAIAVNTSYENCDGSQSVEFTAEQSVAVDPYLGQEFTDLAIAPEYYDNLEAGQDPPGELPGDIVEVELDLSDWASARNFQLRFQDYWPSDGWGAIVDTVEIQADGELIHQFDTATEVEEGYIVEDSGSNPDTFDYRFADANSFWTYQFAVPSETSELTAVIEAANGFDIDGRKGVDRDGSSDDPTGNARVAHMSPDAPNVDVYVDGGDPVLSDVPFGTVSDYAGFPAGERQVEITAAGDPSTSVFSGPLGIVANKDFTLAAAGEISDGADQPFEPIVLEDDNSTVGGDSARLRAVHVSPDAPTVDITAAGGDTVLFDGVPYGGSGYTTLEANDYTVEIRGDTETNDGDVIADFDVSLNGGTVYTAFAAGYLDPSNSPGDESFDLIVAQDSTDDN
jgi:hypothetical protein